MKKILFIGVLLLFSTNTVLCQSKGTWEITQSKNTITAYEEFLKKYPDSKYKELAQKQLADLHKLKEIQDSIKNVKIKEALLVSDKIIPGISILEVLSLLSLKNLEAIIFPTGAKTFTGTAKISGFELEIEKGIVVSKEVNQEDLGSDGFETHTTILNNELDQDSLPNELFGINRDYLITNEIKKLTTKLNIEWIDIPAGRFIMGTSIDDYRNDATEHSVTLNAFKMSKYEITIKQFKEFIDATGYITTSEKNNNYKNSNSKSESSKSKQIFYWGSDTRRNPRPKSEYNHPVANVSWYDAKAFAEWLGCRLPTEAEWEYACKAGTTTKFNTGNIIDISQANYKSIVKSKNLQKTSAVGTYVPNAWGLYDMHGNVKEWCYDIYDDYTKEPQLNPIVQSVRTNSFYQTRTIRGGSWGDKDTWCSSAHRLNSPPNGFASNIGFRIVSNIVTGIESVDTSDLKNNDSYLLANGIKVTTLPKFGNKDRDELWPDYIRSQFEPTYTNSENTQLLEKCIKTNDIKKIEKIFGKPKNVYNGLYASIELGNIDYVKYFVEKGANQTKESMNYAIKKDQLEIVKYLVGKGANPTNHINYAIMQNKYEIVKYLIDKGARFINKEVDDIDGQVYLVNANDQNDKIPILIVPFERENKWFLNDEQNTYLDQQVTKGIRYLVMYKTKKIQVANSALIDAIANNSLQIVELLIKNDTLVRNNAVIIDFYDFKNPYTSSRVMSALDNRGSYFGTSINEPIQAFKTYDGYICINETPSPAIILSPIQFAVLNNANQNIIDALRKSNANQNY